MKCPHCGYKWETRKDNPKSCPRCKCRFDYKLHPRTAEEPAKPLKIHKLGGWPKHIARRFALTESSKASVRQVLVYSLIVMLLAPALALMLTTTQVEVVAASPGPDVENLWVDSYDARVQNWNVYGTLPYLDAVDFSANYIKYIKNPAKSIGDFGFTNLPFADVPIDNVQLHSRLYSTYSTLRITIDLHDGSDWVGQQLYTGYTGWNDFVWDVTTLLDTSEKVNNAKIMLTGQRASSAYDLRADAVYLEVNYTIPEPEEPTLLGPENGITTADSTPTFTWENGAYAENHRIEVGDDLDWSSVIDNETSLMNTWTPNNGYGTGIYYWRVWAVNAAGENVSENVWEFTITTWWDTNWGNRRKIETNPLNPENYQIKIFFDNLGNMKSDLSDLRFMENIATGIIPHWVENYTADNATVWIRRLENADNSIYVYYSNPAASSVENGDNVFVFFDNFDGDSLDTAKWTQGLGTSTVADSEITITDTDVKEHIYSKENTATGHAMRLRVKFTSSTTTYDFKGDENHRAWEEAIVSAGSLADVLLVPSLSEAESGDYNNIENTDDARWETTLAFELEDEWNVQYFKFEIEEDADTIDNIEFLWEGYGPTRIFEYAKLYVWDNGGGSGSWVLYNTGTSTSDENLENTITSDITNFIVENSGERQFWLAVKAQTSAAPSQELATDYVRVKVSYTPLVEAFGQQGWNQSFEGSDNAAIFWVENLDDLVFRTSKDASHETTTGLSYTENVYNVFEIRRDGTQDVELLMNDVSLENHSTQVPTASMPIYLTSEENVTTTVDWVFIRRYVEPEPTATVGEQEPPPVLPTKPTLSEPANNVTITDETPTFKWTKGKNADYHRLRVSSDNTFTSIVEDENIVYENYYTIPSDNFLSDGKYWWRVSAMSENGENASDTWSFTVKAISVFEASSGVNLIWKYTDPSGQLFRVVMSENGNYLATISDAGGVLRYFSREENEELWNVDMGSNGQNVAISDNGRWVAASCATVLKFYDNSGTERWTYTHGAKIEKNNVSMSGDGVYVTAGGAAGDPDIMLFEGIGGSGTEIPVWSYTAGDRIREVAISDKTVDNRYIIAAVSHDHYIRIFDNNSSTPIWENQFPYTGAYKMYTVDISKNGKYVVAGTCENTIYLIENTGENYEIKWTYDFTDDTYWANYHQWIAVSISDNGQYIAGAIDAVEGWFLLWSKDDNTPIWIYRSQETRDVEISGDGSRIIGCGWDGKYNTWGIEDNVPIWYYGDIKVRPDSIAISENGSLFAGIGSDELHLMQDGSFAYELKTEEQIRPHRILTTTPEFSFKLPSRKVENTIKFRVVVGENVSDVDNLMWNPSYIDIENEENEVYHTYAGKVLSPYITYQWRVRLKDNENNWSPWSVTRSFEIVELLDFDNYRTITFTEDIPDNYQAKVVIPPTPNMDENLKDLLFYDSSYPNVGLPYWIENMDENVVWVKVHDNNPIKLCYNNGSVEDASYGDDTFIHFDNFDGTEVDFAKWTTYGTPDVSGGWATLTGNEYLWTKELHGTDLALRTRANIEGDDENVYIGFIKNAHLEQAGLGYHVPGALFWGKSNNLYLRTGTIAYIRDADPSEAITTDNGTFVDYLSESTTYELKRIGTDNVELWANDDNLVLANYTEIPYQQVPVYINAANATGENIKVDWIFLRRCLAVEPTVTIGGEETWGWKEIEEWTGTVEAPVGWELVEEWSGTVKAGAEWNLVEQWSGNIEAFAAWSEIESWQGTIQTQAGWTLIESWGGTVEAFAEWGLVEEWSGAIEARAEWTLIEEWTGTVANPVKWNIIEMWTGTIESPVAWQLTETWDGDVQSPSAWDLVETWTGAVQTPLAAWVQIEFWSGTILAYAEWQSVESWTGTVQVPTEWELIETWSGAVEAPTAWQLIESWSGTIRAPTAWSLIETWTGSVEAPAIWQQVENWTGTVQAPTEWSLVETWSGTVEAPTAWQLISTWSGTIQTPSVWDLIETWTGTVQAPSEWSEIENWSGTIIAVGWTLIETWDGTIRAPAWNLVETWAGTIRTLAVYQVSVSITPDNQSGTLGSTLTYTVTVVNIGGISDNYNLTSSDSQGWPVYLDDSAILNVASSASESTTLNVGLSTLGTHTINVTATSQGDGAVSDTASTTAISAAAGTIVGGGDASLALAVAMLALGLVFCLPFVLMIRRRRGERQEGEVAARI